MAEKYESVEKDLEMIKNKSHSAQAQNFALRRMLTREEEATQPQCITHPRSKEILLKKKKFYRQLWNLQVEFSKITNPLEPISIKWKHSKFVTT